MDNDARQLASAAQQYFLESNNTTVAIGYTAGTGTLAAPLSSWVKQIGKGYTGMPTSLDVSAVWSFSHPLVSVARSYNSEGQKQ